MKSMYRRHGEYCFRNELGSFKCHFSVQRNIRLYAPLPPPRTSNCKLEGIDSLGRYISMNLKQLRSLSLSASKQHVGNWSVRLTEQIKSKPIGTGCGSICCRLVSRAGVKFPCGLQRRCLFSRTNNQLTTKTRRGARRRQT